ncbi:MAG TPA: hypothetical protein VKE30_11125 [Chthoniobacterales bacterium]|nr:hypothetical protein [Chthoniobacterales bacterium]
MNSPTDLLLLAVGAILPSVFAGLVFFHRQRKYANWAKVASIIAAIGGFIWGGIQWALLHAAHRHRIPLARRLRGGAVALAKAWRQLADL